MNARAQNTNGKAEHHETPEQQNTLKYRVIVTFNFSLINLILFTTRLEYLLLYLIISLNVPSLEVVEVVLAQFNLVK